MASDVSSSYDDLWQWSVDELEDFWAAIWTFFDVQASTPYQHVLGSREMPGTEWFPGARLSYAEHIFRGKQDLGDRAAARSELRELDFMTWGELRDLTARIATGLRFLGVGPGDRVVAYIPNIPEAIAAFLACASIGAMWSSCSPDFGARSVVDRFAQIEPKVLIAVDGYRYGGKDFDRSRRRRRAARRDPVAGVRRARWTTSASPAMRPRACSLARADQAAGAAGRSPSVPFDHPLWVLYISGTTGLPKAIVHGQGGVLLEHLKKMHLHLDAPRR